MRTCTSAFAPREGTVRHMDIYAGRITGISWYSHIRFTHHQDFIQISHASIIYYTLTHNNMSSTNGSSTRRSGFGYVDPDDSDSVELSKEEKARIQAMLKAREEQERQKRLKELQSQNSSVSGK